MDMSCVITSAIPFSRSLKRYCGRRQYQYQRIDVSKKSTRSIRLGGKRKLSWKIKVVPKLKLAFMVVSRISWLLQKLWDGYMNVMFALSGDVSALYGNASSGAKRIPQDTKIVNGTKAEQFEDKLVFEIYKELKASQESVFY